MLAANYPLLRMKMTWFIKRFYSFIHNLFDLKIILYLSVFIFNHYIHRKSWVSYRTGKCHLPAVVPSQVTCRSRRQQICIVSWRWQAHWTCATDVQMAQHKWQGLNFIRCEITIIPQYMIFGGATCSLH